MSNHEEINYRRDEFSKKDSTLFNSKSKYERRHRVVDAKNYQFIRHRNACDISNDFSIQCQNIKKLTKTSIFVNFTKSNLNF